MMTGLMKTFFELKIAKHVFWTRQLINVFVCLGRPTQDRVWKQLSCLPHAGTEQCEVCLDK